MATDRAFWTFAEQRGFTFFSRFGSFVCGGPLSAANSEQVQCAIPLLFWHSAAGVSVVATIERTAGADAVWIASVVAGCHYSADW